MNRFDISLAILRGLYSAIMLLVGNSLPQVRVSETRYLRRTICQGIVARIHVNGWCEPVKL